MIKIKAIRYLIFNIEIVFIKLKQIFIKVLFLKQFNLKYYIWIEINILIYIISKNFSQLVNLSQSYLKAYFLKKMILVKI